MEAWQIVAGPRPYEPPSSDCAQGWAGEVARGDERRTVRVEVARSAAVTRAVAVETVSAIRDCGCSMIARALAEGEPPSRIVIGTTGVFREAA
jgi:hypothetical protein